MIRNSEPRRRNHRPGGGFQTRFCRGRETAPQFHHLARPSQGHSHSSKSELQWPHSVVLALGRRPLPYPWASACAGATMESRPPNPSSPTPIGDPGGGIRAPANGHTPVPTHPPRRPQTTPLDGAFGDVRVRRYRGLRQYPGPSPWTPASAGATVERRSSFYSLMRHSQGYSHSDESLSC